MSLNVTKDDFQSALHTEFLMQLDDDDVLPLQLVECVFQLQSAMQECFTLLFRATVDAPNEQSVRSLRHETLGSLEIFLVPVKKNADGLFYEAVFNRLLK